MFAKTPEEKLVVKFNHRMRPDPERVEGMQIYLDYLERYIANGGKFKGGFGNTVSSFSVFKGMYNSENAPFDVVELDDPEYTPFYIFYIMGEGYRCIQTPNLPDCWNPPMNLDVFNTLNLRGIKMSLVAHFEYKNLRELCGMVNYYMPDSAAMPAFFTVDTLYDDLIDTYTYEELKELCGKTYKDYSHLLNKGPSDVASWDEVFYQLYKKLNQNMRECAVAENKVKSWRPITF